MCLFYRCLWPHMLRKIKPHSWVYIREIFRSSNEHVKQFKKFQTVTFFNYIHSSECIWHPLIEIVLFWRKKVSRLRKYLLSFTGDVKASTIPFLPSQSSQFNGEIKEERAVVEPALCSSYKGAEFLQLFLLQLSKVVFVYQWSKLPYDNHINYGYSLFSSLEVCWFLLNF